LLLQGKFLAARDKAFSAALCSLTERHERVVGQLAHLQREANEAHVRKTESLTTSIQANVGALVAGMTGQNRELLGAINSVHHQHLIERREDQRDTRVALEGSTAALARVERALEHRARLNGVG
jgi:hypothetical protein